MVTVRLRTICERVPLNGRTLWSTARHYFKLDPRTYYSPLYLSVIRLILRQNLWGRGCLEGSLTLKVSLEPGIDSHVFLTSRPRSLGCLSPLYYLTTVKFGDVNLTKHFVVIYFMSVLSYVQTLYVLVLYLLKICWPFWI